MNVLWKLSTHAADGVGTVDWVDLWLVVNSGELAVDSSSIVMQVEVLIDGDVAPLRDVDIPLCLSEGWERMVEVKHNLDLLELHWSVVLIWSVGQGLVVV